MECLQALSKHIIGGYVINGRAKSHNKAGRSASMTRGSSKAVLPPGLQVFRRYCRALAFKRGEQNNLYVPLTQHMINEFP